MAAKGHVKWFPVSNEEYNEQAATINGVRVVLYSDKFGEHWWCIVGESEPFELEANDGPTAQYEAEKLALEG